MKRILTGALILTALAAGAWLLMRPESSAQALPEYSAQTGEPCATCHISPSGGGQRGPRGQAWVGSGKPGQAPELLEALEILGVTLDLDQAAYSRVPENVPPAQALQVSPAQAAELHRWLRDFPGN